MLLLSLRLQRENRVLQSRGGGGGSDWRNNEDANSRRAEALSGKLHQLQEKLGMVRLAGATAVDPAASVEATVSKRQPAPPPAAAAASVKRNLSPCFSSSSSTAQLHPVPMPQHLITPHGIPT